MFTDSEEYTLRKRTPFRPPTITLSEVRAAIPARLFERSAAKSLAYICRDILFACILYKLAVYIPSFTFAVLSYFGLGLWVAKYLQCVMWICYWWWQGLVFGALWTLGHEAGHGTLFNRKWANQTAGFLIHSFLLIPYYSWRRTHSSHHKSTAHMERDENFIPRTRAQCGLPPASQATPRDYHEIFEDAPLYTLLRMLGMQLLGWQAYLIDNTLGLPSYPPGTNHFSPSSPLFKPSDRPAIIASNCALLFMTSLLYWFGSTHGLSALIKLYLVPYFIANHWVVMLTFLQHSDPTIPHYRNAEWTFVRGALCTVDRPLLGWMGRVFLHNIAHDHIAHHFFSSIPFYNLPEVTEVLRDVLGDHYNYDTTNTFVALYRSFTQCAFVEDEGSVLFYRDRQGESGRELSADASGHYGTEKNSGAPWS